MRFALLNAKGDGSLLLLAGLIIVLRQSSNLVVDGNFSLLLLEIGIWCIVIGSTLVSKSKYEKNTKQWYKQGLIWLILLSTFVPLCIFSIKLLFDDEIWIQVSDPIIRTSSVNSLKEFESTSYCKDIQCQLINTQRPNELNEAVDKYVAIYSDHIKHEIVTVEGRVQQILISFNDARLTGKRVMLLNSLLSEMNVNDDVAQAIKYIRSSYKERLDAQSILLDDQNLEYFQWGPYRIFAYTSYLFNEKQSVIVSLERAVSSVKVNNLKISEGSSLSIHSALDESPKEEDNLIFSEGSSIPIHSVLDEPPKYELVEDATNSDWYILRKIDGVKDADYVLVKNLLSLLPRDYFFGVDIQVKPLIYIPNDQKIFFLIRSSKNASSTLVNEVYIYDISNNVIRATEVNRQLSEVEGAVFYKERLPYLVWMPYVEDVSDMYMIDLHNETVVLEASLGVGETLNMADPCSEKVKIVYNDMFTNHMSYVVFSKDKIQELYPPCNSVVERPSPGELYEKIVLREEQRLEFPDLYGMYGR